MCRCQKYPSATSVKMSDFKTPVRNVRKKKRADLKTPVRNVRKLDFMNQIPNIQRARITAILCRVISELAGGDPADDIAVASALIDVTELCYQSKTTGDPAQARAEWIRALDLTTETDWLFTAKKVGNEFEFKQKSVQWVRRAGVN
jgi:hypothetical protein